MKWFLIQAETKKDIGKNEKQRFEVKTDIGNPHNEEIFTIQDSTYNGENILVKKLTPIMPYKIEILICKGCKQSISSCNCGRF